MTFGVVFGQKRQQVVVIESLWFADGCSGVPFEAIAGKVEPLRQSIGHGIVVKFEAIEEPIEGVLDITQHCRIKEAFLDVFDSIVLNVFRLSEKATTSFSAACLFNKHHDVSVRDPKEVVPLPANKQRIPGVVGILRAAFFMRLDNMVEEQDARFRRHDTLIDHCGQDIIADVARLHQSVEVVDHAEHLRLNGHGGLDRILFCAQLGGGGVEVAKKLFDDVVSGELVAECDADFAAAQGFKVRLEGVT